MGCSLPGCGLFGQATTPAILFYPGSCRISCPISCPLSSELQCKISMCLLPCTACATCLHPTLSALCYEPHPSVSVVVLITRKAATPLEMSSPFLGWPFLGSHSSVVTWSLGHPVRMAPSPVPPDSGHTSAHSWPPLTPVPCTVRPGLPGSHLPQCSSLSRCSSSREGSP